MIILLYILDTYAWIEYFIGSKKGVIVRNLIDSPHNRFITLHSSVAELHEWCLKEEREFDKLFGIIRSASSIEPIDLDNWIGATSIKREMRKYIKDFGLIDAILLAKQKEFKCGIITGDKHFGNLKNVEFLK